MNCSRSICFNHRPLTSSPLPYSALGRRCGHHLYRPVPWQPAAGTTRSFLLRAPQPAQTRTFASTSATKLKPLRSGTGIATLVTVAAAAVALSAASVAAWLWSSADDPTDPPDSTEEPHPSTRADGPPFHLPAGMLTSPTYGRPGYLTAEQEIKFKELWLAILSLTGYASQENGKPSDTASIAASSVKKKRRFGSLRRSRGPEDDTGADPEDKYGQSKEFKQALASQTPEELAETIFRMSKHDSPDGLVLRYLRARKWNVHNALVMLISTVQWRANEAKVEETIMQRGEHGAFEDSQSSDPSVKREGEDFLTQFRKGKSYLHGCDKDGRPVCIINVRFHHAGEQTQSSLERYTIYTIETGRLLLVPPVDTATLLFDMTDFGRANMDYTPVKFMIKCFEANYPESLGRVMVHNAPWLFQGIWAVIKGWLDPVVASKINFTKGAEQLSEYIPIEHIPKSMGGKENWEFEYVEPLPNENAGMQDTETRDKLLVERRKHWDELMRETVRWCRGEGDVKVVQEHRDELIEKLRVNYWQLDPHVRARSWYDRTGVLSPGGKVDFYPHRHMDADAVSVASGESVYYDAKTDQDEE